MLRMLRIPSRNLNDKRDIGNNTHMHRWIGKLEITILSAIVQGVLMTGRIDGPYALNDSRKWTLSEQIYALLLLAYE